jgi:hypothetical protein
LIKTEPKTITLLWLIFSKKPREIAAKKWNPRVEKSTAKAMICL